MPFLNFDTANFLHDYWQKKPLLIRNPWQDWSNPLAPDELAGLACEDGVEARLITQKQGGWKVEHGPLSEKRFGKLGKHPWTLLVQAVDHVVPSVAALLDPFRFIPNWRIDDVMVSYASDGGGVGPHFDHYDVFLIQGLGQRSWQIGAPCDTATALLPHDDLRLLANFNPSDEWLLNPGDMLYLPPGIAHNGVAVGDDCMTYSIGFRAPSRAELIAHYCDHLLSELADDDRYADPALPLQTNSGEISAEALDRLHRMVTEKLHDRAGFARWFGSYNSTPKYPDDDTTPETAMTVKALRKALAGGAPLTRNPASRFSFIRQGAHEVTLFVDGECFECLGSMAELAERLCANMCSSIDPRLVDSDAVMALIAALNNRGSVALEHRSTPQTRAGATRQC